MTMGKGRANNLLAGSMMLRVAGSGMQGGVDLGQMEEEEEEEERRRRGGGGRGEGVWMVY